MIDFNTARTLVGGNPDVRNLYPVGDFIVADYGWEDDQRFLVVAGTNRDVTGKGDGPITYDGPVIYVSKQSGELTMLYGLQVIGDPASGMSLVSN